MPPSDGLPPGIRDRGSERKNDAWCEHQASLRRISSRTDENEKHARIMRIMQIMQIMQIMLLPISPTLSNGILRRLSSLSISLWLRQ